MLPDWLQNSVMWMSCVVQAWNYWSFSFMSNLLNILLMYWLIVLSSQHLPDIRQKWSAPYIPFFHIQSDSASPLSDLHGGRGIQFSPHYRDQFICLTLTSNVLLGFDTQLDNHCHPRWTGQVILDRSRLACEQIHVHRPVFLCPVWRWRWRTIQRQVGCLHV